VREWADVGHWLAPAFLLAAAASKRWTVVREWETYFLLHEGPLEDYVWKAYAVFAIGCLIVCMLINLLAARDVKKIRERKQRRKRSHRLFRH
jgi:heme exporter protein D